MDEPRWLVDEMLGRLSRYLRFLGYDAEYVRGASDDELVRRAGEEHRRVITRDRSLARRVPGSVLLTRTDIAGQMQQLGSAFASLRHEVRFDRCSLCNGPLRRLEGPPVSTTEGASLPPDARSGRTPVYRCTNCGHLYWEGTHTRSVRSRLREWFPPETGPR